MTTSWMAGGTRSSSTTAPRGRSSSRAPAPPRWGSQDRLGPCQERPEPLAAPVQAGRKPEASPHAGPCRCGQPLRSECPWGRVERQASAPLHGGGCAQAADREACRPLIAGEGRAANWSRRHQLTKRGPVHMAGGETSRPPGGAQPHAPRRRLPARHGAGPFAFAPPGASGAAYPREQPGSPRERPGGPIRPSNRAWGDPPGVGRDRGPGRARGAAGGGRSDGRAALSSRPLRAPGSCPSGAQKVPPRLGQSRAPSAILCDPPRSPPPRRPPAEAPRGGPPEEAP